MHVQACKSFGDIIFLRPMAIFHFRINFHLILGNSHLGAFIVGYHNKNHNTLLSFVLIFETKIMFSNVKQWKGVMYVLSFQPIIGIMNYSNQLNKFWMSCSSIKRNVGLHDIFRITYFHLEYQNLIWTSTNVLFLQPLMLISFWTFGI